MNLLPIIFTFLLILGLGTMTFFRTTENSYLEQSSIKGFHRSRWKLHNQMVRHAFSQQHVHKKHSLLPQKEKKTPSAASYFREKICGSEGGKFPLQALRNHSRSTPLGQKWYKAAAALLRQLYSKAPFGDAFLSFEAQLLDNFLHNQGRDFFDFFPEDPRLHFLYYQMLKGTNTYVVGTGLGIPPLSDFFTLGSRERVLFDRAPQAIILAIFGEEIAEAIEREERKKNKGLSLEHLQQLLQKHSRLKFDLGDLQTYFLFTHQKEVERKWIATDRASGISRRKRID